MRKATAAAVVEATETVTSPSPRPNTVPAASVSSDAGISSTDATT